MPRLGIGMPLVSTATEAPVLAVQDFFWLNDISGELTPIHTASRTNLIPYSTGYSPARGWDASGAVITNNQAISPDKTQNASLVELEADTDRFAEVINSASGGTYTFSFYVKAKEGESGNWVSRVVGDSSLFTTTFVDDSAWVRVSKTFTKTGSGNLIVYPAYRLDGTSTLFDAYIWGAQLEQDSRASAYIPTSGSAVTVTTPLNDTHNAWDYDSANLMLEEDPDSEGSWQRPSNVVLNHDFADLGVEKVTNGSFTTADLSSFSATYATQEIVSEELKVTLNTANGYGFSFVTFTAIVGKSYKISFSAKQGTSTGTRIITLSGLTLTASSTTTGDWSYEGIGVATATTCQFKLQLYGAIGDYAFFDNVSVKQVDPNDRWSTTGTVNGSNYVEYSSGGARLVTDGTGTGISQSMMVVGTTYELTFDVIDATLGSAKFDGAGISFNSVGSYSTTFTAPQTALTYYRNSGAADITIDNVTLKEYAAMPLDV